MTSRPAVRRSRLVAYAAAALVVGYVACMTYVTPRPYYLTDIDAEQDYYYNARLVLSGLPGSVHHPGTPVYQLAALVLRFHGAAPDATQAFLNSTYLLVGLLTGAAILVFARLALRDTPTWVAAAALATVIAWPPFLSYLNIFGIDAFIVLVGLPTVGVFWYAMQRPEPPGSRLLALGGAGLGLGLAVKMSFLPLVVALAAGYLVRILRSPPHGEPRTAPGRLRSAAALFGGLAAAYLVAMLPVLDRVALIWVRSLTRPDAAPAAGGLLADFSTAMSLMAGYAPLWLLLVGLAAAGAVIGAGARAYRSSAAAPDLLPVAVALALLGAAFVYTAAAAVPISPGSVPGIRLRNMSPTVLGAPLLVLYAWTVLGAASVRLREHRMVAALGALLAAATVAAAVVRHGNDRARFVRSHAERVAATAARLEELRGPAGRIAFWTESAQDFLGPASFHFWGNYRYANQAFDGELLARFPGHAFLQLRSIGRTASLGAAPRAETGSRYGRAGELYWTVRRALLADRPHYTSGGGLLSGGPAAGPVSLVAFPEEAASEPQGLEGPALLRMLESELTTSPPRRETIAGVPWLVLRGTGSAPVAVTPEPGR